MRPIPFIFSAILLFSCGEKKTASTASGSESTVSIPRKPTIDSTVRDNIADTVSIPANQLIVPGYGIGLTRIGQSTQEVLQNLGKPDEGDAAMGKSVNTWYSKNNRQYKTQVYSSMRNGDEGDYPKVKSIRINSPVFQTVGRLKAGSNLKEILPAFPALLLSGSYKTTKGKLVRVYDDMEKGIAFEIDENDTCVGICVHNTGEKAFVQYLPFEQNFTPTDN